jgi:hypothetical protein
MGKAWALALAWLVRAVDLLWSGPPGDRTLNPRIKSPLLCQLS